jgi:hypothetical protein
MQEFCEGCEGEALERPYRTVRRDPAFADNARLPGLLQARIGETIYTKLGEGDFQGETFSPPPPCNASASANELASRVQDLLDVFVRNGYCLKASTSDVRGGAGGAVRWRTRLEAPANLWGMQTLEYRHALVSNAFDAFAVQAYLRASGFSGTFELDVQDVYVDQTWTAVPVINQV